MAEIFRIWIETSYNPAFRCGGWAYVLAEGRAFSGAAGGERTPSQERLALAGLADALKGLPAGIRVEVHSSNPLVLGAPRRIAGQGDPPAQDLDLWAQVIAGLKDRPAQVFTAPKDPRTPTAFATAWAELGRDKAKNAGAFRSAIPKTNLAKAGVPA